MRLNFSRSAASVIDLRQELHRRDSGAAMFIVVIMLVLIAWAGILYGLNTLFSDSHVTELDEMCQSLAQAALEEFPHKLGGYKSLNPFFNGTNAIGDKYTPSSSSAPNAYQAIEADVEVRLKLVFEDLGLAQAGAYLARWDYFEHPDDHAAFWKALSKDDLAYTFAPINDRCLVSQPGQPCDAAQDPQSANWNNGIVVRLGKLAQPLGLGFSTSDFAQRIAQVQCRAEITARDLLFVQDTSYSQGLWTKAGDGGGLQDLCTVEGMRYEQYSSTQQTGQTLAKLLGQGGPKRSTATTNPDVFSLCFRVCVGTVNSSTGAVVPYETTPPASAPNDFMLLAGPAGKQAWQCPASSSYGTYYGDAASETGNPPLASGCVKPIAISDLSKPDGFKQPYQGQRVVCHTAHSAPQYSHIMLTAAAEGQSRYCAFEPGTPSSSLGYGYHPICSDSATFFRNSAYGSPCYTPSGSSSNNICKAAAVPTAAQHIIPRANGMRVIERDIIEYLTKGIAEADDANELGGMHNARNAVTILNGNKFLLNGAIALEYQADQLYQNTATINLAATREEIRKRHYAALTNFFLALDSMKDARQCLSDYPLQLKAAALAAANYFQGGDSRCDLDATSGSPGATPCYQTEWQPRDGSADIAVRANWSTSAYRFSYANYSDFMQFANGDPRLINDTDFNTGVTAPLVRMPLFESVLKHSVKYKRPLEQGAMTRNVVQQNALYGCEAWYRRQAFDTTLANSVMWPALTGSSIAASVIDPLNNGVSIAYRAVGSGSDPFSATDDARQTINEAPTVVEAVNVASLTFASSSAMTAYSSSSTASAYLSSELAASAVVHQLAQSSIQNSLLNSVPQEWQDYYHSPAPGFFRVGPPVTPLDPASLSSGTVSQTTVTYLDPYQKYDWNKGVNNQTGSDGLAGVQNRKTLDHMILGWSPSGNRYVFSALELAAMAMQKAVRRPAAVAMTENSDPEKVIVFNVAGAPSDIECLERQAGMATFDFTQLSSSQKAAYCAQCWSQVRARFDCAWAGNEWNDSSGSCSNDIPDYGRKMLLHLTVLWDNSSMTDFCGYYNFSKQVKMLAESDLAPPWLQLNIAYSIDELLDGSKLESFTRGTLRSR